MYSHTHIMHTHARAHFCMCVGCARVHVVCVFLGVVCVCVWCRLIFRFLAHVLFVYSGSRAMTECGAWQVKNPSLLLQLSKAPPSRHGMK